MSKQLENRSGKMLCIWLNQSMDHHQLYTTILKCTKNGLGSNKSTKHVGKNNSHFIKKMKDTDQDESDDRIDPDSNSGSAGDVDVSGSCSDPLHMGTKQPYFLEWIYLLEHCLNKFPDLRR